MRKNKKIIYLLISVALFAFATSVNALSNTNITSNINNDYYELGFKETAIALRLEDKIKEYYNDEYPNYFGGVHLSEDATNVVLKIVKENIPDESSLNYKIYDEIVNFDKTIKVEYVKNSYNELNNINEKLNEYFSSNIKNENIISNYVDIINNNITVEFNNSLNDIEKKSLFNSDKLKSIKKYYDEKIIVLNLSEEKNTMATTIKSGGSISTQGGICSMGFRTKYNGKAGYVTAGHCVQNGVNSTIPSGNVKLYQFSNNQNYDYAFIQTNSSYSPSNALAYNNGISTKLAVSTAKPNFVVNTPIAKVGATTGFTTGQVKALNVSVYYSNENKIIKGLVSSNLKSADGDSGGVVLLPYSDSNGGGIPIGILSGGNGTLMYFTSINNLPAALRTGRY